MNWGWLTAQKQGSDFVTSRRAANLPDARQPLSFFGSYKSLGVMAPLEHAGWSSNDRGEVVNGELRSKGGETCFKHAQELKANDVWRMRVEVEGEARVGFAGAGV